jgi:hypothetical protein
MLRAEVDTRVLVFVAACIVLVIACATYGVRRALVARGRVPIVPANAIVLAVPHAKGAITLDGDTDDLGWQLDPARTGAFVTADGESARPHTEAKLVWGDGHLYVELYAADQDIRAVAPTPDGPVWERDSFHLVFSDGVTERSFDLSPLGTLTDGLRQAAGRAPGAAAPFDYRWNSGAHVSHEVDGTPNVPGDDDEEWVIEMAIPFEALGLSGHPGDRIGLSMHRCDTTKTGDRVCGSWGEGERRGVIVLE